MEARPGSKEYGEDKWGLPGNLASGLESLQLGEEIRR